MTAQSTPRERWLAVLPLGPCLLGLLAASPPAAAQSETGLWTEAALRANVAPRWRIGGALHLRFDRDVSRMSLVGPEARVEHRLPRGLRLGGGYRFEWRRIAGDLRAAHRLHLDLRVRLLKAGRLRLGYRLRLQERLRDRPSGRSDVRGTLRNRLALAAEANEWLTSSVAAESFTGMHGRNSGWLRKVRVTLGLDAALGTTDLDVYYRAQVPVGRPDDPVEHILGFGLRVRIDAQGEQTSESAPASAP